MTDLAGQALGKDRGALGQGLGAQLTRLFDGLGQSLRKALEIEIAERRIFLWLPVAAGAGAVSYLLAEREPSMLFAGFAAAVFGTLAVLLRSRRLGFVIAVGLCAVFVGLLSASFRTARVAAPVLDRIRVITLEGYIEEMDFRRAGARFLLRPERAEGLAEIPYRVRLTLRRTPPFEAGTYVKLKARLLPPARASLPGGYDFARDAWFARIGAVGNVLGRIDVLAAPHSPDPVLALMMAVDRGRNALAARVDRIVGGEAGAIAAAMVTGKRDLLSDAAREIIRQAGIFHIITISGVQMTLVAGIFFVGLRRLLALSSTLALRYPIKKWAAAAAIVGAVAYDILTGSRVGTERALFMTMIMLLAVLMERQAFSMRNLGFAALLVILLEPEALLGASFQLSFAAVAALVAVYEARIAAAGRKGASGTQEFGRKPLHKMSRQQRFWHFAQEKLGHHPAALLFATFCATSATGSFMAYDFHELSPYVLIGNPLTLTIIELFAVPGALLGTFLYPLGLDAFVWRYVGAGINFILWAARGIGSMPGSSIHLGAFAPWSLVFLTLAVLSAVIWRTLILRASAIPLALIGLYGAAHGPSFDLAIAATGDALALRGGDGRLVVLGHRPSAFAAEQWLRADADPREAREAIESDACDKIGCVGILKDGRSVALVFDKAAFAEDCLRADVLVTPLRAPPGCAAAFVIDRDKLAETGSLALTTQGDGFAITTARAPGEDRPWSRAPKPRWGKNETPKDASLLKGQVKSEAKNETSEPGETDDHTDDMSAGE
ncbi:MAG: ComEC/Rec2 family competence protein [Beijerinckiaceae bacterium]